MTREEAIQRWVIPAIKNTWNEKKCQEIIKVLEQDQCEDCISRQAAIDAIRKDILNYEGILTRLPSVNPQEPKWIPVSERLPEEDDFYLVTAKVGNELIIDISEYTPKNDFWDIPHEIVAWMPLPKLYEPQKSEDEE